MRCRPDAACELNVLEQTRNVCLTTVLQDAWDRGQQVAVHGLIYGLHDGLLRSLKLTVMGAGDVESLYQASLQDLRARFD
ncbi:carbonic anhydrase [Cupriavidus taiwanensis]|uniref:carbonic anhydrase n=1 Tax=Cupriavidus taiwanensis TaxID=164546 RepID=UPI00279616C9|nr:carbonic anhydrase [Cupriavidus taiwanensis]